MMHNTEKKRGLSLVVGPLSLSVVLASRGHQPVIIHLTQMNKKKNTSIAMKDLQPLSALFIPEFLNQAQAKLRHGKRCTNGC